MGEGGYKVAFWMLVAMLWTALCVLVGMVVSFKYNQPSLAIQNYQAAEGK
jgi:hypothetical protein